MTRKHLRRATASLLVLLLLMMQLPVGALALEDESDQSAEASVVSVEAEEPADEAQEPADEAQEPADEAQEPAGETQEPADEAQEPAGETQEPAVQEESAPEEAAESVEPSVTPYDPWYEEVAPETEEDEEVQTQDDEGTYAVLYDDGTLMFQKGDAPDEGRTVAEKWLLDLNAEYNADSDTPWYNRRDEIKKLNFRDKIAPASLANWFMGCSKMEEMEGVENVDVSKVTSMRNFFRGCSSLKEVDLIVPAKNRWNTSKVTDMSGMFYGCATLTELDLSMLSTASLTNLENTFRGCSGLKELSLVRWNVSAVTNMSGLFRDCTALTDLDLNEWDTKAVKDMSEMFRNCSKLETIRAAVTFVTTSVTNSTDMFTGCGALKGGSGTAFTDAHTDALYARLDTPDAAGYFSGGVCAILYEDGTLVFQYGDTPDGRSVVKIYPVDMLNSYAMIGTRVTNVTWYENHDKIKKVDFVDKIRPRFVSMWFYYLTDLEEVVHPENLDLSQCTQMVDLFFCCEKLKKVDVSSWDTSHIEGAHAVFYQCGELTELDVSKWDTSSMTDISGLFNGASKVKKLDVSGFNTSKVIRYGSVFRDTSSLTELDVSKWDTSAGLEFGGMFRGCSGLTELDITGWTVPKGYAYGNMFRDCTNLKTILVAEDFALMRGFIEGQPTLNQDVFTNCTALVGGNGTVYSPEHTDYDYARIDTPETPGYFTAKKAPVEKKENTIKVSKSFTKTVNTKKDQTFKLKASANGAALSYNSGNAKKVKVDKKGKVTVKKGFMGKVTITITSAETEQYLAAKKKVTVTVNPSATTLSSARGAKRKVTVTWKKNTTGKGYELQFSRKKNFKKIEKTIKIKKKTIRKATAKKLKKGKYYIRIRIVNGKLASKWSKVRTVKVR